MDIVGQAVNELETDSYLTLARTGPITEVLCYGASSRWRELIVKRVPTRIAVERLGLAHQRHANKPVPSKYG